MSKKSILLYIKGFFMGAADIIPGVSGGTVALITNIYEDLIDAIHSIDLEVIGLFFKGQFKESFSKIKFSFLIPLLLGILSAIFIMANFIHYFLEQQQVYTYSLFFGLILGSAVIMILDVDKVLKNILVMIFGAIVVWLIVGMIPVETPDALWFIFLTGIIAITAMVLPGISGAYIILLLGKYEYVTEAVKHPFNLDNFIIIVVFSVGAVIGIVSFSRVVKKLFERHRMITISFLIGMMIGSLRKIYPYKEVLETKLINGEVRVIKEGFLAPWAIEESIFLSLALVVLGFLLVILLHKLSKNKQAH